MEVNTKLECDCAARCVTDRWSIKAAAVTTTTDKLYSYRRREKNEANTLAYASHTQGSKMNDKTKIVNLPHSMLYNYYT